MLKQKHYTNKFIKNQQNRFPFERVEDVCPLSGGGQNGPLLLLLPSRMCQNSSCGEAFHTQAVVGVELLATTLASKNIASVLPHFVLANHLQRLDSFVTDITGLDRGEPSLSSCAFSPHTDLIQQQHDFLHKPAFNTCRSSCQSCMS